jgi:hypothetical protein
MIYPSKGSAKTALGRRSAATNAGLIEIQIRYRSVKDLVLEFPQPPTAFRKAGQSDRGQHLRKR